ncbi:MAG: hypothetical protein JST92_20405 [Deltaproteobacteria bacterium]|nr:hypothetical protein [Deltaproteobacteria bacterium]
MLGAALLSMPWRAHIDHVDAQLYVVIARHAAESGRWLDLSFLPGHWPQFREHLPFGFWPAIAAMRALGEWAVPPMYALLTLSTAALIGWLGARLSGPWGGLAALLAFMLPEATWHYGGRLMLEPPLLLLSTAAAAPVLLGTPSRRGWLCAAGFGALAVLIKGPFGLVPLVSVVTARAITARSIRILVRGAIACAAAAVPLALFLWADASLGDGSWAEGYGRGQLLASATGARRDGVTAFWFPLAVVAGRFWPGLPASAAGVWRSLRRDPADAEARLLAWASFIALAILCVPQRKWGNHALVAFPLLSLLAGAGVGPWLARALTSATRARNVEVILGLAAALAVVLSVFGVGARVQRPPCAFSTTFAPALAQLSAGTPIAIVSAEDETLALAELAEERHLVPWPAAHLADARPEAHLAFARPDTLAPDAAPWHERARADGWVLLER